VGVAFLLRSERAERYAALAVGSILVSACVAGYESILRLLKPRAPEQLGALAVPGGIGFLGKWVTARVREGAGRRLASPALIADGAHAYVSLGVVASAAVVALGLELADPLIGLAITCVILRITRQSWRTVRGHANPSEPIVRRGSISHARPGHLVVATFLILATARVPDWFDELQG
jgi:divalent metal cation (Fe/Co/Zn/Cd) transporter